MKCGNPSRISGPRLLRGRVSGLASKHVAKLLVRGSPNDGGMRRQGSGLNEGNSICGAWTPRGWLRGDRSGKFRGRQDTTTVVPFILGPFWSIRFGIKDRDMIASRVIIITIVIIIAAARRIAGTRGTGAS